MDRRTFCSHACQTITTLAVGSVVQGCGGSTTSPSGGSSGSTLPTLNGTVSGRIVTVPITSGSSLAAVGGTALVQSTLGALLVARISQEAFSVMTATCTHQGCTITNVSGTTFICPCHGSQFSTSGAVVQSPATRALTVYASSFANDTLTVTV
ncbi:MAG: Rieske 2Fe-2S domain-containing protein [Vicinamibacterales bacterium]